MKKTFYKICLFSCVFAVSGCVSDQSKFRQNVGVPEGLIDNSSEVVTIKLTNSDSLSKISSIISRDVPTRAELRCSLGSVKCSKAKAIFASKSIPITMANDTDNGIALFYDRVVVRDCDSRYADNINDGTNSAAHHSSFGCAISANIVQMVSDRKQFTNPALMDLPDAEKGSQSYNQYLKPSTPPSNTTSYGNITEQNSSSSGSSGN